MFAAVELTASQHFFTGYSNVCTYKGIFTKLVGLILQFDAYVKKGAHAFA